jgi:hypothetical protein
MTENSLPPLMIAKAFGIPLIEVSVRLGVTPGWLRVLARNPRHARRVTVAVLEACLAQKKLELSLESLVGGRL